MATKLNVDDAKLVHWPAHAHRHARRSIESDYNTFVQRFSNVLRKAPKSKGAKLFMRTMRDALVTELGERLVGCIFEKRRLMALIAFPYDDGAAGFGICSTFIALPKGDRVSVQHGELKCEISSHAVARYCEHNGDPNIQHALQEIYDGVSKYIADGGKVDINRRCIPTLKGAAVIEQQHQCTRPLPTVLTWLPQAYLADAHV